MSFKEGLGDQLEQLTDPLLSFHPLKLFLSRVPRWTPCRFSSPAPDSQFGQPSLPLAGRLMTAMKAASRGRRDKKTKPGPRDAPPGPPGAPRGRTGPEKEETVYMPVRKLIYESWKHCKNTAIKIKLTLKVITSNIQYIQ